MPKLEKHIKLISSWNIYMFVTDINPLNDSCVKIKLKHKICFSHNDSTSYKNGQRQEQYYDWFLRNVSCKTSTLICQASVIWYMSVF